MANLFRKARVLCHFWMGMATDSLSLWERAGVRVYSATTYKKSLLL